MGNRDLHRTTTSITFTHLLKSFGASSFHQLTESAKPPNYSSELAPSKYFACYTELQAKLCEQSKVVGSTISRPIGKESLP